MRRTLKSGALKASGALELIVRSALEATRPTRFLQIVAGLNAGLPCSLLTPRGAGLSPCTEHHSAGPHQAASSRATLAGGTARAAKLGIFTTAPPAQICDQACSRPTLSVEMMPHVRGAGRQRGASRQAASQRRGSGDHTPGRSLCDCAGGAGVVKKMPPRRSLPSFCFAGCERG